ncbi:hypothetical protein BZA70DRAFT_285059 [Myxozyma melibiosi]|uniref:C2H2-type domain-containing protein n=1 Tax=Myxozyma melibiosi TaxID=54550 RepID=A0ABR1EYZ0_9ASCO
MGSTSSKNAQAASTTTTTSSNPSASSTSSSSQPTPLTDYSSSSANTAAFGGSGGGGGGGAEAGMMAAPRKIRARHRFRRTRGVVGKVLNRQAEVARPAAEQAEQGEQEGKSGNGEKEQEGEAVDKERKSEQQRPVEQQRQELEQEVQELLQDDKQKKDDTEQEGEQGQRSGSSGTKRRLSASSSGHGDGSPLDASGNAQKRRNICIALKPAVERDPGDDEIRKKRHDELKKKLPLSALTKEQERFELMERQRKQQEELRVRLEQQQQQAQYRNVYQPQLSTETPSFFYSQPTPTAYPHPNAYGKPLPLYEPPLSVPALQHTPAHPLTSPHVPAIMVPSQMPSLSPPAQDGNFRVLPANQFVSTAPESFYRPNTTSPITPPALVPQMNSPTMSYDGLRYSDLTRRRTIFENPIPTEPPKPTDEPFQYRRIKIMSNGTLSSKIATSKMRRAPLARSFPTLEMVPANNSLQVNGRSILSDPVPLAKPRKMDNGRSVVTDPARVKLVEPPIEDSDNNNDNSVSNSKNDNSINSTSTSSDNSNSNNNSANDSDDDESNGSSKDYEEAYECRCGHAFATKGNINRHLRTLRYDPDHMQFVHPNNVVYARIFPRTRLTQAEYSAIREKNNAQKSA